MMDSQGRRPLDARHLIVVELHPVLFAPVRVVDAVRPEDAAKKDAGIPAPPPANMIPARRM